MEIILNSVQIIQPGTALHKKKRSLLIKNGKIEKINNTPISGRNAIDGKGMMLSIGWFDMRSNFCDPGYEHKEDLASGSNTAAAGGFTEVALLPNTHPVIQTKNEISYLISRNESQLTQLHPYAAVTVDTKGEEMTEMIDLHYAGAVAFTDGDHPIWHTNVLLKSLQ